MFVRLFRRLAVFVVAALAASTLTFMAASVASAATGSAQPQNLALVAGNETVGVSWQAPDGITATGYRIQYYSRANMASPAQVTVPATTTAITLAALNPATTYHVRVAALNKDGIIEYTPEKTATTWGPPGAPSTLRLTRHVGSAELTWSAPGNNGGVNDLTYTAQVASDADFTDVLRSVTTQKLTATFPIDPAGVYYFRVQASTSMGAGPFTATQSGTIYTKPTAPRNVIAEPGAGSLVVGWDPPAQDGGARIGSYLVEYATNAAFDNAKTRTVSGSASTATLGSLAPGTTYYIRVTAVSSLLSLGSSPHSSTVTATTVAIPAIPDPLVVSPGIYASTGVAIDMRWSEPGTGGVPTAYTVEYSTSSGFTAAATKRFTVTANYQWASIRVGLKPATQYYVRINAKNSAGVSPWSVVRRPVTADVPLPPANVKATADVASFTATWDPSAGVSSGRILSYTVSYAINADFSDAMTVKVPANSDGTVPTTLTVPGLDDNTTYHVRVSAANAVGTSGYGTPTTVTTPVVDPLALSYPDAAFTQGVAGQSMSPTVAGGTGSPYQYTVISGQLPSNLTLNPSTGVVESTSWNTLMAGPTAVTTNGACAVSQGGALLCWGATPIVLAGLGSSNPTYVPVVIPGAESGVTSVALSPTHLCIVQNGAVRCLGHNEFGQLGNGSTTSSTTWVQAVGLADGMVSVATGSDHACATNVAGQLYCWGAREVQPQPHDDVDQLSSGDGHHGDVTVPRQVEGIPSPVTKLVAAGSTTAVLMANQKMKVWHAHLHEVDAVFGTEQDADGALNTDLDLFGPHITDIALGNGFGCMVKDGAAYCWGENSFGQLGDGTLRDRAKATHVPGLTGVSAIFAGSANACAIAHGSAWCWGANLAGQVGTGKSSVEAPWYASPQHVVGLSGTVTSVIPGAASHVDPESMTCATTTGAVTCWGNNRSGQIGAGIRGGDVLTPTAPSGLGIQPGYGSPVTIRVEDKDGNAATAVWTPHLSN